jgi:hypothetical protein
MRVWNIILSLTIINNLAQLEPDNLEVYNFYFMLFCCFLHVKISFSSPFLLALFMGLTIYPRITVILDDTGIYLICMANVESSGFILHFILIWCYSEMFSVARVHWMIICIWKIVHYLYVANVESSWFISVLYWYGVLVRWSLVYGKLSIVANVESSWFISVLYWYGVLVRWSLVYGKLSIMASWLYISFYIDMVL